MSDEPRPNPDEDRDEDAVDDAVEARDEDETLDEDADERVDAITIQFSHPDDDDEVSQAVRSEGLTPLLVNGRHVTATTEDHLQQALDHASERQTFEDERETRAYRRSVVESLAVAIEQGEDGDYSEFPNDALLLLAEGLVHHGHSQADALPYCAVSFARDNVDRPRFDPRPTIQ